ncbi:hypothetical protein OIO90_005813 [Microbotryomycetes sp. JL221]|nr:hypothetical protein OIO90_005813 [Microbotryomycetes sp. JL221]
MDEDEKQERVIQAKPKQATKEVKELKSSKRIRNSSTSKDDVQQTPPEPTMSINLLLNLPHDLFVEVCSHLESQDLIQLAKVNKQLHKVLLSKANDVVWSQLRRQEDLPGLGFEDMTNVHSVVKMRTVKLIGFREGESAENASANMRISQTPLWIKEVASVNWELHHLQELDELDPSLVHKDTVHYLNGDESDDEQQHRPARECLTIESGRVQRFVEERQEQLAADEKLVDDVKRVIRARDDERRKQFEQKHEQSWPLIKRELIDAGWTEREQVIATLIHAYEHEVSEASSDFVPSIVTTSGLPQAPSMSPSQRPNAWAQIKEAIQRELYVRDIWDRRNSLQGFYETAVMSSHQTSAGVSAVPKFSTVVGHAGPKRFWSDLDISLTREYDAIVECFEKEIDVFKIKFKKQCGRIVKALVTGQKINKVNIANDDVDNDPFFKLAIARCLGHNGEKLLSVSRFLSSFRWPKRVDLHQIQHAIYTHFSSYHVVYARAAMAAAGLDPETATVQQIKSLPGYFEWTPPEPQVKHYKAYKLKYSLVKMSYVELLDTYIELNSYDIRRKIPPKPPVITYVSPGQEEHDNKSKTKKKFKKKKKEMKIKQKHMKTSL